MPLHETLEGENRERSKMVLLCFTRDLLLEIHHRSFDATIVRSDAERHLVRLPDFCPMNMKRVRLSRDCGICDAL